MPFQKVSAEDIRYAYILFLFVDYDRTIYAMEESTIYFLYYYFF